MKMKSQKGKFKKKINRRKIHFRGAYLFHLSLVNETEISGYDPLCDGTILKWTSRPVTFCHWLLSETVALFRFTRFRLPVCRLWNLIKPFFLIRRNPKRNPTSKFLKEFWHFFILSASELFGLKKEKKRIKFVFCFLR